MIYTLTLNPAIDKTAVVPGLRLDSVNRIQAVRTDVGGKGINVSKCLRALGGDSTAVAFWGGTAGEMGVRFLHDSGIPALTVRIDGTTRTNLKLVDPRAGQNTDINEPGPTVSNEELLQMRTLLEEHVHAEDILILSGSVPGGVSTGIYRELAEHFGKIGTCVLMDVDGECFRQGVLAAPFLVKPNATELSAYAGKELKTRAELLEAAQGLLRYGVREVVVSMADEGALMVGHGHLFLAHALRVPVHSTVGAGDAMVAALAYGLEKGLAIEDRLKLAIAISAASVMCSGTQAPRAETVRELIKDVTVEELVL